MQAYIADKFADTVSLENTQLKLGSNERLLGSFHTMLPWQTVLWAVLLLSSGGSVLVAVIAIAYFLPGGEGLGLYDRVLRLVLRVNTAVFGPHLVHLTTDRLVIDIRNQPPLVLSLGELSGTETRSFRLSGNLFVHLGGAVRRRAALWVVSPRRVAEQIHRACGQGR